MDIVQCGRCCKMVMYEKGRVKPQQQSYTDGGGRQTRFASRSLEGKLALQRISLRVVLERTRTVHLPHQLSYAKMGGPFVFACVELGAWILGCSGWIENKEQDIDNWRNWRRTEIRRKCRNEYLPSAPYVIMRHQRLWLP